MRTFMAKGTSMVKRGGSILPMKSRTATVGRGFSKDFFDNADVKHPYQTLQKPVKSSLETIKVKSNKPRKYISLNL